MDSVQRQQKIEKFGNAYTELSAYLKTLTKEQIHFKPAADKWSAHEIIVHIADAEANSYVRMRKALAEPGTMIFAYDQDKWAATLDYTSKDYTDYLELFRLLRKLTYEIIINMPESEWAKQYNHEEYGLIDLNRWLDIYAGHISGHISQIERNIAEMGNA